MVIVIVVLGMGLVALGAVVLMRYPDRPGGVIRFHNVEVGSKGAGLPLIVLGAALAVAAVVIPGTVHSPGEDSSDSGAGEPQVPGLDVVPQTDCTRWFFAQRPPADSARVRSVELDATDRRVLTVGERQDAEFGMVLSDTISSTTPRVLGAVKLSQRPGVGFHISGIADEQTCQPVTVALASDPGVPAPAALGDYIWVTFRLGGAPYVLLLNSSNANTEVLVTLHRKG
ncbi:MAG: hypothetical protein ACRDRV_06495 [Pseudonocardiaceae bacterium]